MTGLFLAHLAPPNKHDSFDTKVSETIVLFLFVKMPVAQEVSALLPFGLVSSWVSRSRFSLPRILIVVLQTITLKLFFEE